MKLLEMFKEWCSNCEEEKKFLEMWENKYSEIINSGSSKFWIEWHKEVCLNMFKMQKEIESLKERLTPEQK